MNSKLSISCFFPAYNDEVTIVPLVLEAIYVLEAISDDYEVIVINDGSTDGTKGKLDELSRKFPQIQVIHHPQNRGYGGALRSGFASARKEWVFYTDGDGQYDVSELKKMVSLISDDVDIINGYKTTRSDTWARYAMGKIYYWLNRSLFNIKLKDIDCDFRLIRSGVFKEIELESNSGFICVEMVKKMEAAGFRFLEVPVGHYHRRSGKSQFFNIHHIFKTVASLWKFWKKTRSQS